jgi:hypothetical protein
MSAPPKKPDLASMIAAKRRAREASHNTTPDNPEVLKGRGIPDTERTNRTDINAIGGVGRAAVHQRPQSQSSGRSLQDYMNARRSRAGSQVGGHSITSGISQAQYQELVDANTRLTQKVESLASMIQDLTMAIKKE